MVALQEVLKDRNMQALSLLPSKIILTVYGPAAAAKSLQSYPTLCDPKDGSPPGSPVPGILQARTLEWVAISFSMISITKTFCRASQVVLVVKNLPANAGDLRDSGSILGW